MRILVNSRALNSDRRKSVLLAYGKRCQCRMIIMTDSEADTKPPEVLDENSIELIERRLSDNVRERVESSLKWRYGFIFAVFLGAAALFGYDASKKVESMTNRLNTLDTRLDASEPLVDEVRGLVKRVAKLNDLADTALDTSRMAQDEGDVVAREQTRILVEEFGNFLSNDKRETANFYRAVRDFARGKGFDDLDVYANVRFAKVQANLENYAHAWKLFEQAEVTAKKLGVEEYVDVLLHRAATELDHGLNEKSMFTLAERAQVILEESHEVMSTNSLMTAQGRVLQEIGTAMQYRSDLDGAIEYYLRAAETLKKVENYQTAASLYRTAGRLLKQRENYDDAESSLLEARWIADYLSDPYELYQVNIDLSELYRKKDANANIDQYICNAAKISEYIVGSRDDFMRKHLENESATYQDVCGSSEK